MVTAVLASVFVQRNHAEQQFPSWPATAWQKGEAGCTGIHPLC
jgi:hypothetical protein